MSAIIKRQNREKQTSTALVLSHLVSEPLFTLYSFLVFILYKDLGASTFQVALLTALKPVITILSFYWSAGVKGRTSRLKPNVLWANFLMRAPFLLLLWFDSVWFVILAAVNYMFFYRAGIPAWLEILKRNMHKEKRGKIFSISSGIGYAEGILLAIGCGKMLDHDSSCWKLLFVAAALIGLISLVFQARLSVDGEEVQGEKPSFRELFIRPWRDSFRLIKARKDFSTFQWGFMLSGFGLMLIQPAIPLFMVDILGISYLEMAMAISIAKGLGFALSSSLWPRWVDRTGIFQASSIVFIFFGLFTMLLFFSMWSLVWFYLAYFCYGVGQGGSHFVWNMSGPMFSGKEESSSYTGVNVAMAGIRGAVGPPLGGWFCVLWGPLYVLLFGGIFCFYSGFRMFRSKFAKESFSINT